MNMADLAAGTGKEDLRPLLQFINSSGNYMGGGNASRDDILALAKRYDPNATMEGGYVVDGYDLGNEGGSERGHTDNYHLNMDYSKLPKFQNGASVVDPDGNAIQGMVADQNSKLYNNDAILADPNYGYVTSPKNLNRGFNAIGTLGPLAIAALTMGGAAGMLPGMMGAQAAAGAAGAAGAGAFGEFTGQAPTWMQSLVRALPSAGRAAGSGNWLGVGASGLGAGLNAGGMDSTLAGGIGTLGKIAAGNWGKGGK